MVFHRIPPYIQTTIRHGLAKDPNAREHSHHGRVPWNGATWSGPRWANIPKSSPFLRVDHPPMVGLLGNCSKPYAPCWYIYELYVGDFWDNMLLNIPAPWSIGVCKSDWKQHLLGYDSYRFGCRTDTRSGTRACARTTLPRPWMCGFPGSSRASVGSYSQHVLGGKRIQAYSNQLE